ncbi:MULTISPECIES: nuclear transport factor 2 family protein [Pseudomonadaceae]|uniref:SnoaL-like domain-containing protein n=1 Tax=Ectopseudomonas mendocina (strain ymp) TaxID=399739 RepID=A4XQZ9_ECTM1|nr:MULTISPECIES: nuclear transport factor 2 family protein [Pseudomonas]ARS47833.1 cytosolic protein [Pseudomonas mendocina]ATH83439.1 cytosolic protein [Pseudomonas mendocina]MBA4242979.1 cytosolic protein [Pseudomonas sp.]MBF8159536.1 nuclear transport factor 2 family protein [Pseudomonas mendocina]MDH0099127.1 nuclear transport factor 2 family protein [Pseudomonas sp. GD04158]
MPAAVRDLLQRYFQALNDRDARACLALVSADVTLEPNQGFVEHGREAFAAYLERHMRCYRESLEQLVILTEPDGRHAACEYRVQGEYLATDEGLPEACGQRYEARVGAFFEMQDGLISRISLHFNLPDWLAQVDD